MFERHQPESFTGFVNRLSQLTGGTSNSKEPFVQESDIQNVNNSAWVAPHMLATALRAAEATTTQREQIIYPVFVQSIKCCHCKTDQNVAAGHLISSNAKKFVFAHFKIEFIKQNSFFLLCFFITNAKVHSCVDFKSVQNNKRTTFP